MHLLVRAVVMGFGLAAGAALYKRVASDLGLDPDAKKKKDQAEQDATVPPMEPPGDALRTP